MVKTKKQVPSKTTAKGRTAKPRAVAIERRTEASPQAVPMPVSAPEPKLDMKEQIAALERILAERHSKEGLRVSRSGDDADDAVVLVNAFTETIILDQDRTKKLMARDALRRAKHGVKAPDGIGEYKECLGCDGEIEVKRLRAVPWALLCIKCQDRRESPLSVDDPLAQYA